MESNNNNGQEVVKIKINYPEGFSGTRHLKDGSEHEMALNSAQLLERKGIATILDASIEEVVKENEDLIISTGSIGTQPEATGALETLLTTDDIQNVIDEAESEINTLDEGDVNKIDEAPEVIEGEAIEEVSDEVITEEVVDTENVSDTPQVDAPNNAPEVYSKKAKKSATKPGK